MIPKTVIFPNIGIFERSRFWDFECTRFWDAEPIKESTIEPIISFGELFKFLGAFSRILIIKGWNQSS